MDILSLQSRSAIGVALDEYSLRAHPPADLMTRLREAQRQVEAAVREMESLEHDSNFSPAGRWNAVNARRERARYEDGLVWLRNQIGSIAINQDQREDFISILQGAEEDLRLAAGGLAVPLVTAHRPR